MLVLGVDAGGTSTRAVLATMAGDCVGLGRGGSGNPTASSVPAALAEVRRALADALIPAGAMWDEVAGIVIAMAGHDAGGGASDWILDPLKEDGFAGTLTFESDLLALYASGTVSPVGYGIVCGTGASAVRVEDGRIVATADGLGWLLGDRGSGFWIGRAGVNAAVDELDGIGAATALTPAVLRAAGVAAADGRPPGSAGRSTVLEQLIRALYARRPVQLAEFAPLVFDAADGGDPVASRILDRAGELLVETFRVVRAQPAPVVIGGGVASRPGPLQQALRAELGALGEGFPLAVVDSGAVGATVLALRRAGVAVDASMLARLQTGVKRWPPAT